MRRERAALLALAASGLAPGLWALLAPASFHRSFPGGGLRWVAPLGPYDEHLVRDVGAAFLALTVLSAWAAVRPHPELVRAAAVTWLVLLVPHAVVHVRLDPDPGQLAALAVQLALPVLVLLPGRERRGA